VVLAVMFLVVVALIVWIGMGGLSFTTPTPDADDSASLLAWTFKS
jgi:hypothetical protein